MKVYTVVLVEDSGDGEMETLTFSYVYATHELAKKAIDEHVRECYTHQWGGEEPDSDGPSSVEWHTTIEVEGKPIESRCVVKWGDTTAWAELTINECELVEA